LIDARAFIRNGAIKPSRGLGQCFLTDANVAKRVVDAAELTPGDHVVEVGPGVCALTALLCERAGTVIAVEIDGRLTETIKAATAAYDNFVLIQSDFLKVDAGALRPPATSMAAPRRAVFVSNIPYYISTHILTRLFEELTFINRAVVMMQKEVAGKLLAKPSTAQYCMLSLFAGLYCKPEKLFSVTPQSFAPQPKVDSAVVLLDARTAPSGLFDSERAAVERNMYFRIVRASFSNRRKTLENVLIHSGLAEDRARASDLVKSAGVAEKARGESLDVYEFAALARVLAAGETPQ